MNHDLNIFFSMNSLVVFLLVLTRIGGMLTTAPLISTFPIPMQMKVALAALASFIVYPVVFQHSHFAIPHDLITMTVLIAKELMIGLLIGFCANLIFIGIQIGGQLLSMQMGLTIAEAIDPVTRQNVPVVGQFYLFIASMVFLYINGHHILFNTVIDSYLSIPIGLNFDFGNGLVEKMLYYVSQLYSIGFGVVMPIFGLLLVMDIALAFMSKMMPQMNIFMVALPFKIYIGLIFMSIFMLTTANYFSVLITKLLESFRTIFV